MRGPVRLLLPLLLLAASCRSVPPPAVRPVRTVGWSPGAPRVSDRLVVLLPGRLSPPEEFRNEGVSGEIERALGPVDLVAVDAHLGYYLDGVFLETLTKDVLLPARRAGFREVWIVGISLGGSGALAALRARPDLVDGVVLLAPYLGSADCLARVRRFGRDLLAAPPPKDPRERFFEETWVWLQEPDAGRAPILLGFGKRDRYVESQRFLATLAAPERVAEVEGGHDWGAWRRATAELLRGGLPPRVYRRPGDDLRGDRIFVVSPQVTAPDRIAAPEAR